MRFLFTVVLLPTVLSRRTRNSVNGVRSIVIGAQLTYDKYVSTIWKKLKAQQVEESENQIPNNHNKAYEKKTIMKSNVLFWMHCPYTILMITHSVSSTKLWLCCDRYEKVIKISHSDTPSFRNMAEQIREFWRENLLRAAYRKRQSFSNNLNKYQNKFDIIA